GSLYFKLILTEVSLALSCGTFISIVQKLPSPEIYDVVEGYIKISMECSEIFRLMEGKQNEESEMILIFMTLEAILLRTASDLSHFSMVGAAIVKKLLTCHMKHIYSALYSENNRYIQTSLNLLAAMVSQGPESAQQVFSHIEFKKNLSGLARKRDKKGKTDVRVAYIQFALSFLISGDSNVIKQVLDLKDFLPDILSTGLMEDRLSTVKLLISTLQKKVVHSKSITKTQKVHFFNNVVLNHIASLYRWDGIIDVMLDEIKVKEVARTLVRELTHSFLLDICCSLKHGISFYDPSFGITGRSGNIVLLRFIVGLRTATQDEMIGELVVNILKVCPDLLQRYFKETQFSFVPRQTSTWLDNMKLLRKIFEAQPEISKSFSSSEFIPLPRLLQMVLVTTMPSVCSKAMFTQGLNLDDKIVKHTTLSFIAFLLRRAEKNIDYCLSEEFCSRSDHYCKRVMEDFVQNYREALCKMFPDITNIVAIWQSLTKKEQNENQTTEQGSQYKSSLNDLSNSGVILLKAVILQVLCLYQKVIPYVITQSTFDYSKMLNGIFTENIRRYVVPPVLQHQMLKLCLDLPANKFSWFQVSIIQYLLVFSLICLFLFIYFCIINKTEFGKLCLTFLETGVFEHTWKELEIWLKHLLIISEAEQETVVQFLERILVKLVSNPWPYTDIEAALVQEAISYQTILTRQEADTSCLPVFQSIDIFKHPVLEQWFLARDVQTFSHISLKDDSFKVIGTEMNSGILNLLKLGAPKLKKLDCLRLISKFMNTIANSVLHEIKHIKKNCSQETEKTFSLQALEELHTFMDVIELRKLVSALLNLPKKLLTINCENDKKTGTIKKLGTLGHTLVLILRENNMQTNDKENLVLSIEHLRDVGNLMLSGASEDLEKVILHTLQKEPLFAQFIQTEVLVFCLKRMTNICLSIAAFLIQHCSVHLLQFELWCLEPQSKKVLKMNGDIFLSLINGYLKHLNQEVNIQLQSLSSLVLANLKETFLERLLSTALSDIAPKKLALKFEILCSLIRLSLSSDDLTDVISHLPRLLERIENYQTWKLVDCVTNKFDGIQDEQSNWKKTLLMASLRWLTSSYATNKESDESMKEKELTILNKLKELIVSSNGIDAVEWNSFIKLGLKNRYRETAFLEALNFMLAKLYNDDNIPEKFLPLPMIHMMIISHSLFLPTILNEKVENSWDLLAKESIIDILLTVVRRCGHVCEMSHIAVILGAYGASLSRQDQKLLLLLRCYEQNGVSLAEFGVLLWGPAAVEFQKARKSLGKSIWQQPSTDQILTLLDKDKMHQTLLNFPQYRHILPQVSIDLYSFFFYLNFQSIYDNQVCLFINLKVLKIKKKSGNTLQYFDKVMKIDKLLLHN
uniref:URB1 N-terminal domain-containing protein n=1 Tax=Erpetoichthys calabaricus TaxID=27687 RepID=A0A8C4SW97_ERPCA